MVLLSAFNLKKTFVTRDLFSGVSFELAEGDRCGLIGVNGSGKSTLFHLLTGEMPADEGDVHLAKFTTLGYVRQHVGSFGEDTVYNEALSIFSELMAIEHQLSAIAEQIPSASGRELDGLIARQHRLTEQFERADGYTFRARTRSTLLGLGFSEEMLSRPAALLSGGEKAKLLLARMLLSGANLLLLDEPTNHLDIKAVEWLEEYLLNYKGAYIVISHDRYFLDRVTNRTLEIENGKLTAYSGNYSAFMDKKAHEQDLVRRHYKNTLKEIKRIEGIVAQQRQWNRERNIRTAESKLKQIAKLEETLVKPDEAPEALSFRFSAPQAITNDVVVGRGLAKSFDEPLFEGVDLLIKNGEHAFLLGNNGCGKTTLFKILLGKTAPDKGERLLGQGVTCAYYDQTLSDLNLEKTVLDELWDAYPHMTHSQIRTALGRFLFKGDDVYKLIGSLSGGERARLSLLKLMLSGANLLFLDEPTNHLDISSREALESALLDYDGTLFVISHDRYFINRLASRIMQLTPVGIRSFDGDYDDYAAAVNREAARAAAAPKPVEKTAASIQHAIDRDNRAELRRQRARLGNLEREINSIAAQIDEASAQLCDPEVAADYIRVGELTEKIDTLRARSDELELEWLELSESLEG